jgi:hypothetical protein
MAEDPSKADFSLADGHGYAINNKHVSAYRLNLQFYLWKDALGFNIHRSIPPYLPAIADVATGTAAWLIGLSRILPKSTRLDGFDNNLEQAPEVEAPAVEKLLEMSSSDGRHDWTLDLPQFMGKEGFVEVEMEKFGDEDRVVRACNEQHLLTMEEFAASLVKMGKKEAAEEFYRTIGEAYQESTKGAALCIPRVVCVGRKPN